MFRRRCKRCAWILQAKPEELLIFEPMHMDRCMTSLWREREAEKVRTLAILEHAKYGHG